MFGRFLALILCALNIQQDSRCRLNSRMNFRQPLPVLIRNGRLLEPNDNHGNVFMRGGDTLTISCEGAGGIRHPNVRNKLVTATITCRGDDLFFNEELLNTPSAFDEFSCDIPPIYLSRNTGDHCYNNYNIYEVGYNVDNAFYPVYETCFNDDLLTPVYSKYTQKGYNSNFQQRVERPYFKDDRVYKDIYVDNIYSASGLRSALASAATSYDYSNLVHYLTRGHLAAKTDFVFAFGERATFHYVNCAPQWYGFNSGNWNTLEVDLRIHVHNAGYDTIIYTGTYDTIELNNVSIYLGVDHNNNRVIPVPLYYYKVIYDPNLRLGTAFVGINKPYYTLDEARELFFCHDVCRNNSDFKWLTWSPDRAYEGYGFCCTVTDFRRTVPHLPYFEVNGLLT